MYSNPVITTKNAEDYEILKTLGKGGCSTIFLARDKITFEILTIKAIEKEEIVEKKHIKQILFEKKILQSVNFPFITTMTAGFTDNVYVYFVIPFESGGELFTLIRKSRSLSETLAKFYAGQVVLGVEYLHHCSVIHRDIKPENIFISREGYLKLGDFGFSKIIESRTWTLCGTPEYLAPEIILSKGYSFAIDWWATGVLIYEMTCGYTPFYSSSKEKQYDRIISGSYKIPDEVNPACKALIRSLLVVDPTKRYGSLKDGVYDIKNAKWFSDIDWSALLNRKIQPPFVPEVQNEGDAENFPECEDVRLKKRSMCLYENEFAEF
ncbi:cAMP-dependent protein kinase catalytic subunit-like [Hyposmocoma kahamanoa]|uniref:cAMP-dependent protein kinase catalytic subunit-like n=1 Tax=Hyposmocoma kahamanoa TaxID=1477025 RepID=UPI000E6D8D4E|nr:cAMP-dependent protein kinase catalytic subunit-like [Hyposmocoma kahamanoa]